MLRLRELGGFLYPSVVEKAFKICEPYGGVRRYIANVEVLNVSENVNSLGVQCEDASEFQVSAYDYGKPKYE